MQHKLVHNTVVLGIATLVMAASMAHATSALPPIQRSGTVDYVNGGIGKSESTAIQAAGKHWPLTLEFAVKDKNRAEFAADVQVVIRDHAQKTDLQVKSVGPFLLAKLTPGDYQVEATLDGKTLKRQVQVSAAHPAKVEFLWPAGT
jgi:hypothetical protein